MIATEFGDVLVDPLLAHSGHGAYAALANGFAESLRASYDAGGASPPDVFVARLREAVRARRPHTRYAAGRYAKPMMFLRRWLGDRAFDRIVMSMVKQLVPRGRAA